MTPNSSALKQALAEWKAKDLPEAARVAAARTLAATAADIVGSGATSSIESGLWNEYLRWTGKPEFLQRLAGGQARSRWAEICFEIIRLTDFSLLKLFEQRLAEHPNRILFEDCSPGNPGRWTYRAIARQVREIAAVFHSLPSPAEPRVALFTENCLPGACCDLACLFYDILDAPLNTHFNAGILADIFDRLAITIAVTDTKERLEILQGIRHKTQLPFQIVVFDSALGEGEEHIICLDAACKRFGEGQIAALLDRRPRKSLHEVATVMFTSGSTGVPKGVSFSLFNLVTKRFARAAALPAVGEEEVLLCFLPLFHTFGRYLEMLGTIYWGGTYIFAGNSSAETVLALLPQKNPTGFISIPLRWTQLQEKCLEFFSRTGTPAGSEKEFRRCVGDRLRWGLSAAGFLDARVFRFFQNHGVELCSGFGMTEATGGITMTPPGEYMDDTNGLPLPGVSSRLTAEGELQISGPYIARYLEDKKPGEIIPYPSVPGEEYWLSTGDLFRVLPNGFYQIIGRVKDIYKNDRGETIAPQRVEKIFQGVPGIKRTFLVGDHRAYNILLIAPDREDPVFLTGPGRNDPREYFRRIVSAANHDLAPFERVVNFTVLGRDFAPERDEVTPKGSLNRKVIETNFAPEIEDLYRSKGANLFVGSLQVHIPRWFFRDLGLLEDEIEIRGDSLWNRKADRALIVRPGSAAGRVRIGDLEYTVSGDAIPLGLFVRQPRLWIGNPSLAAFFPCKEGWDVPLNAIGAQLLRPRSGVQEYPGGSIPEPKHIKEKMVATVHELAGTAFFSPLSQALEALNRIGDLLSQVDLRWNELMRTRLEALATHPEEQIRCAAYRILLLDDPTPDYSRAFPAFLLSGLSFLNEESIEAIANGRFETRRLESLRRRLLHYRSHLSSPGRPELQQQFQAVFRLLTDFACRHPEFHHAVRSELASWVLHRSDPVLARSAGEFLGRLKRHLDSMMAEKNPVHPPEEWDRRLLFDEEIPPGERGEVKSVLSAQNFLEKSVVLACDEKEFDLQEVSDGGIQVSPIRAPSRSRHYRLRIQTRTLQTFELELILGEDLRGESVLPTVYWHLVLGGWPTGPPVLQRMGCFSPSLGAMSVAFSGEPSAWQKIVELAHSSSPDGPSLTPKAWRKLFIQAMATFFRALNYSDFRLVPGVVSPLNVLVPELDFRSGGIVASLAEYGLYENTLSLVRPMIQNFFNAPASRFPLCRRQLNPDWVFDACLEALGPEKGLQFLHRLQTDLQTAPLRVFDRFLLAESLQAYLPEATSYLPLALYNAVDRYLQWEALNREATPEARGQTVDELYRLYRLDRFSDIVRFRFYRETFFLRVTDEAAHAFDGLLDSMRRKPGTPPTQRIELSVLQDSLQEEADREAFSRMVFPRFPTRRRLQITRRSETPGEPLLVSSIITDKHGGSFVFREPVEPREIGQIYRFFSQQRIPKTISQQDRFFVLADSNNRIVAGLCFQSMENKIVQLEGIAVTSPLKGRGLSGAMEEEFCRRMANQGVLAIRAFFFSSDFFLWHGYRTDKRFGGLVKFLQTEG